MFEMTRPREAGLGEPGKRRLWRRAGCGGTGGNGGGTVGARRLVPTKRRGRAWGVPGLPEPGGRDGARGDEHALEGWGGGMVGRAGAGRLAVEEGKQRKVRGSCVWVHSFCVVGVGPLSPVGSCHLVSVSSLLLCCPQCLGLQKVPQPPPR